MASSHWRLAAKVNIAMAVRVVAIDSSPRASIHLPMNQKLYLGFRLAMRYPELSLITRLSSPSNIGYCIFYMALDQEKFVGEDAAI
jgi:hypothetical protein